MSSAAGVRLDVFGIALLFLLGRFPSCDEMVALAFGVEPDLENNRAEPPAAPSDGTELLRVIILPVDQVGLIEISLASSRLTPCLRFTSRLLRGSNSKRILVYNCYIIAALPAGSP